MGRGTPRELEQRGGGPRATRRNDAAGPKRAPDLWEGIKRGGPEPSARQSNKKALRNFAARGTPKTRGRSPKRAWGRDAKAAQLEAVKEHWAAHGQGKIGAQRSGPPSAARGGGIDPRRGAKKMPRGREA